MDISDLKLCVTCHRSYDSHLWVLWLYSVTFCWSTMFLFCQFNTLSSNKIYQELSWLYLESSNCVPFILLNCQPNIGRILPLGKIVCNPEKLNFLSDQLFYLLYLPLICRFIPSEYVYWFSSGNLMNLIFCLIVNKEYCQDV